MTLNITVATERCIYQCADYRLTDWVTGSTSDFDMQKIFYVNTSGWSATVCFAGVGRTAAVNVGQWLAERIAVISTQDPFDRLLDELLKADNWLATVPLHCDNRHSFTVGAFVGSDPVYALVSNFEALNGQAQKIVSPTLSVYQARPLKPTTYVAGSTNALIRQLRWRLAKFAADDPQVEDMYTQLVRANVGASQNNSGISPACFTMHLKNTGEGGGRPHGTGDRSLPNPLPVSDFVANVLDANFESWRHRIIGFSAVRSEPTEDYHRTQLREKPNSPDAYCNFGAYLNDNRKDVDGAESAYRRALELDPNHINALGNLANLVANRGDRDQAAKLYQMAVRTPGPGHEYAAWNYANFLLVQFNDLTEAKQVLKYALSASPDSARLILQYIEVLILEGKASDALLQLRVAREKGADKALVESYYACALHISGAPIGECIAAYRPAIALNPVNGTLKLNLAQLLFLEKERKEAYVLLRQAMKLGIDYSEQMEAQLYFLCHTDSDPNYIADAIRALRINGGCLKWNVEKNIAMVREIDRQRAKLVESFLEVMQGHKDPTHLDYAISAYEKKPAAF